MCTSRVSVSAFFFTLHDPASFVQIRVFDTRESSQPNDGSSTERHVPKQSSHVRVWCTLSFACCTIKGEYIAHTLFPSIPANMAKKESQSSSSVTTEVCAWLVFAGDHASRAVPSGARHDGRY